MNTPRPASPPQYLLIFRGTDWHRGLSPENIQEIMGQWSTWFDGLVQDGRLLGGNPLENAGKIVTGKGGMVADGPFAESKEAVGGYFLLQVESLDEAVAIARNCPALPHGISVEVRPVAPACPVERLVSEQQPALAAT